MCGPQVHASGFVGPEKGSQKVCVCGEGGGWVVAGKKSSFEYEYLK